MYIMMHYARELTGILPTSKINSSDNKHRTIITNKRNTYLHIILTVIVTISVITMIRIMNV